MKCPNCGAEMKESRLYCENCGEDIHIVPDFEPELELHMEKNLERISEEVARDGKKDGSPGALTDAPDTPPDRVRRRRTAGWIGLGTATLALIAGIVMIWQHFSADYQIRRARQTAEAGQYERAVGYYARAVELDRYNVDLKLELADVYFLKNDKEQYERLLREIVADPGTDMEQLESAYGKLIAIYRAREDYQTISDMLLTCENESIRAAYGNYLAEPPQFGVAEGEYDEVQALKLTVTGRGTIYYTLDGSEPDEHSDQYTAPILLENGSYTVRAMFVNENGVKSRVAEASYRITVAKLDAPELNVDDGEYDTPVFITVTNDTEEIYYTTDGTVPTMESQRYAAPIPMPLGSSHFRFARLEPGRSSEIVERRFVFELDTDITPEQAVDLVRAHALDSGRITDNEGRFDDTPARYQYQYLCVANIGGIGDSDNGGAEKDDIFYVVAEELADGQGILDRTGNYFAVNAFQGSLYKLQTENGIYALAEI